MDLTLVLTADDKPGAALTPDAVSHCAMRLSKELGYGGAFMCLPGPGKNAVILTVLPDKSSSSGDADAERLIRHVACCMSAQVTDLAGNSVLADSADNDTSFLEQVPAPEDEIGAIWLHFSITEISAEAPSMALKLFLTKHQLEYENESDGISIYFAQNGVLDLFFDENFDYIDGEMDTTYAGAGMFAEACETAEQLAKELGGRLEFARDDRATFAHDRDFDKLRGLFLESFRQQLTWAVIDDRDGYQAYIGWGTDTYEPEEIPGTIITFLGRYNIDEIIDEISCWGLEAVVDHRFVMRGTRYRGPDDYVKNALTLLWCTVQFNDRELTGAANQPAFTVIANLELALDRDSYIELPINEYLTLCRLINHPPKNLTHAREFSCHYPAGYLKGRVAYGFGSYLRKFKLPGMYSYNEQIPGERIVFNYNSDARFRLDCDISYFDGKATPRDGFFRSDEPPTSIDIGGSATCEYYEPEPRVSEQRTVYVAKAEILIRDERYNFIMSTDSEVLLEDFRDTVYCSRAVEDLDELPFDDNGEKPRAVGGCFFQRGERDPLDSALKQLEPELDRLSQLSCRIRFHGNAELTTLSSKVGGEPYRPAGFILPSNLLFKQNSDEQFEFIAQLNFADYKWPPYFPNEGILQIYYNARFNDPGAIGVLGQKLVRYVYFDKPDATEATSEQGIAMRISLERLRPTYDDYRFDASVRQPIEGIINQLTEFDNKKLEKIFNKGGSRVGGYPRIYAPDPRELARDYDILLFQLDTRDLVGIPGSTALPCIGNYCHVDGPHALLNLFISGEDLKNRKFSNILAVWSTDARKSGDPPDNDRV